MKKIIYTLLVSIAFLSTARAQKAKFGFIGGVNMAWMRFESENGIKDKGDVMVGFSVGILGDLPLSKKISFQPTLLFTQKGESEHVESTSSVVRLNYLELPLNFIYKIPGKSGNFIVGLGPDLSYGLSGRISETYNGTTSHINIKFGNSNDDNFKPFEFSANILAGYEWKSGFSLQLNYNMGFSSLYPSDNQNSNDHAYLKNSYVGLRVGYFIGKK